MSDEHQAVRAELERLQGTIDERKKNLGNTQPAAAAPTPLSATPLNSASSSSSYYSRVNSALPLITKTTWKLAAAPPHHRPHPTTFRPPMGRSTKLILNRPTLPPTATSTTTHLKITSNPITLPTTNTSTTSTSPINSAQALSVLAPPFLPSTQPPSIQPKQDLPPPSHALRTSSLVPSASPHVTPSPVAQTTSNLSNMTLAQQNHPTVLPGPVPAAVHNKTNELIINGVSFVRDTQGKKLVRKTELAPPPLQPGGKPSALPTNSTSTSTLQPNKTQNATPMKASIGGMTYVRTKSGNLVEASALKKYQAQKIQELNKRARLVATVNAMKAKYSNNGTRSYSNGWDPKKLVTAQPHHHHHKLTNKVSRPPLIKKNEQCRFFAKTGACRNGLTCVYQHDPSQPNPHNMEHCSHFPRCNKADCPYPHVKPTTSQICQEFADLGWCSKGAECTERHVRECPEFSTKGTCSNPGCRLRHMINRNKNDPEDGSHEDDHHPPADETATTSDEEGKEGGGLFFTDLTGTDHKGKRKATQQQSADRSHQTHPESSNSQRTFKGISHNTEVSPAVKRVKYDQMADNSDFVMFISSDEEEGEPAQKDDDGSDGDDGTSSEEGHELADDPSSVDSEELHHVLMEDAAAPAEREVHSPVQVKPFLPLVHPLPPRPPPPVAPRLPAPPVFAPKTIKPRNRSSLEPGEEIEEGEIFDDDEMPSFSGPSIPHQLASIAPSPAQEDYYSSSDDDELIARQLLGDQI
ncbi:hypothetical protein PCANC_19297 [Puccinia coronata f. sp. avenae]|uniref:C3H1-type domain-containing protein n=1 Tax=Puccinia coronata f. sp. avenae TaxID=200324 RepID=A0A2N5ULV1_9BASI|nr:hypothetical protein PCANC_19297 [Puccinia coronata f. sp. avenae]PLW44987.1 hypothetical protein PCASD_06935 [Puccinia coronata f. sp. avenae]